MVEHWNYNCTTQILIRNLLENVVWGYTDQQAKFYEGWKNRCPVDSTIRPLYNQPQKVTGSHFPFGTQKHFPLSLQLNSRFTVICVSFSFSLLFFLTAWKAQFIHVSFPLLLLTYCKTSGVSNHSPDHSGTGPWAMLGCNLAFQMFLESVLCMC